MYVDVLIIGLGPAGATVFSELTKRVGSEFLILAIDHKSRPGFPVQCGEFIPSPEEMKRLIPKVPEVDKIFTFKEDYVSTHTNRISFFSPEGKIITTPFDGYTINRGDWNADLIKQGVDKGGKVWSSACAINMNGHIVHVSKEGKELIDIHPKIIIGCDGVNSRVASWTGLAEKRSSDNYAIVKQHFMTNIDSENYDSTNIQMYFGEKYAPGAYSWIIPKSETTANVGAGIRLPMLKGKMNVSIALKNVIENHPITSTFLKNATIKHTIAGAVPVGVPFEKTVNEEKQTILIGDAACQVVSSVGGGIPPSMVAGRIAADVISKKLRDNSSLSIYEDLWKKQLLEMLTKSYKVRNFFDQIASGKDSRLQWYMNRLRPSDIDSIVHCNVPWKLNLAIPFLKILDIIIR